MYDWYNGTPADYPLITEVDAAGGFVELSNFGAAPVNLGGWTLETGAGGWAIPTGTLLAPGKPVVLVRDMAAYRQKYGAAVPGIQVSGLTLNGTRDTLTLKHGDAAVDQLAWGEAQPGWRLGSPDQAPLCRPNPGKDTNTYLDWSPANRGTPGLAGCGK
jgi:hypothetical protein